jgi:hypothetical protein
MKQPAGRQKAAFLDKLDNAGTEIAITWQPGATTTAFRVFAGWPSTIVSIRYSWIPGLALTSYEAAIASKGPSQEISNLDLF